LLAKSSIVDSAEDFGTYLEEFGYSTNIQLGTFELKPEMSYKDIAKLITKS
jgi:cell division protein YceG involved in septum cleavage